MPEDERLLLAEALEQRQQRLEQLGLGELARRPGAARAVAQLGQQRRELAAGAGRELVEDGIAVAGERAQDRDDRRVRQLVAAELDAVAALHARAALARLRGELGEQARLADAGLAGDERQRRAALGGVGQRGVELGELGAAPDQAAARDTRRHERSIAARPGRMGGLRRHAACRSPLAARRRRRARRRPCGRRRARGAQDAAARRSPGWA